MQAEKHKIGLVQDYVKKFTTIMLDILDMTKKDKLFYFIDSLSWDVTIELQKRKVQNLTSTMIVAKGLSN